MGYQSYDLILTNSKADMPEIAAMIEAGKLECVLDPDSPYKFEDYLKMFEKSMSHRAKGKLVIQIASDEAMKTDKQIVSPSDDVKEEEKENSDVPNTDETTTVEPTTEQKEEAALADDNAAEKGVDVAAEKVADDDAAKDNDGTDAATKE